MAYVSLIVPKYRRHALPRQTFEEVMTVLSEAGHRVEAVLAIDRRDEMDFWDGPRASTPAGGQPDDPPRNAVEPRIVYGEDRGLASAVVEGLRRGSEQADAVLIYDLTRGYCPKTVVPMLEALDEGRADVVVASRALMIQRDPVRRRSIRRGLIARVAQVVRRIIGTGDPLSGLVGLSRSAVNEALPTFRPVGEAFLVEVLARTDRHRMLDVPAQFDRRKLHRPPRTGLSELRVLKRVADDRFGNVSRLIQFCVVGASGTVFDLTTYAILLWLLDASPLAGRAVLGTGGALTWDLVVARGLAIGVGLTWNFTLNRLATFSYAKSGSMLRQYLLYLVSNSIGVTISLMVCFWLTISSTFFAAHNLTAAAVGIVAGTGFNFMMARYVVFRHIQPPSVVPAEGAILEEVDASVDPIEEAPPGTEPMPLKAGSKATDPVNAATPRS